MQGQQAAAQQQQQQLLLQQHMAGMSLNPGQPQGMHMLPQQAQLPQQTLQLLPQDGAGVGAVDPAYLYGSQVRTPLP